MARISNAMLNKWSSCLFHSNIRKNPHLDIRSQYRFLGEVTFKNVLFVMNFFVHYLDILQHARVFPYVFPMSILK